jgi:hypothetical protein
MPRTKESKVKKLKELLEPSTLSKDITSSVRTAYTKLGKRLNLKGTIGALRSGETDEDARESSFNCPSEDCGHVFSHPLIALQIQKGEEIEFYACPRCLSKIAVEEDSMFSDLNGLEDAVAGASEPEQVLPHEASSGCRHYLGYLGERDSRTVIPEECMICKDLMDCMHRKVKE